MWVGSQVAAIHLHLAYAVGEGLGIGSEEKASNSLRLRSLWTTPLKEHNRKQFQLSEILEARLNQYELLFLFSSFKAI